MIRGRHFLLLLTVGIGFSVLAQQPDSSIIKKYPFRLGSIGFAIDSLEFFVGDLKRGETFHHEIQMYNFGEEAVTFNSGKMSKFVNVNYNPGVLSAGQAGTAIIDYEVVYDLPVGPTLAEIAIETNDKKNPYKFLYLSGNVVESSSQFTDKIVFDTVPRLIFDHYNYDFGHLPRGKTVVHTFIFTNRGDQDLVIDEINSSIGCSVIPPAMTVIPPGGDGNLIVKVRMLGNFGVQHRTINIKSNDPVNPKITLSLHGSVRQNAPSLSDPDFCFH